MAALVGFGKLMLDEQGFVPVPLEGWLFGVAGSLATLFGARYVWDLYDGLIAFRKSASDIVQPLKHPVFEGVKNPAPRNRRDRLFPWVVTVIQFVALGLALWYFGARWRLPVVGALACGAAAAVALALWRWWRATHPEDDS